MDVLDAPLDCLVTAMGEADVVRALQRLHTGFTTSRESLSGYADDPRLVAAYAAFYLPTNAAKLWFVLDRLGRAWEWSRRWTVVDFGCGPGTYSFAWAAWMQRLGVVHTHVLVDRSAIMRDQARRIAKRWFPDHRFSYCASVPPVSGPWALVLGNVVNECGAQVAGRLIAQGRPDLVVLIEPGTAPAFAHVAQVRAEAVAQGYGIAYPCPSGGACPALRDAGQWCHQVVRWTPPPAAARLGQRAGLDRSTMPMCAQVYAAQGAESGLPVVFRQKKKAKHGLLWQVCAPADGGLALRDVVLPKRGYAKAVYKTLAAASCGYRLRVRAFEDHGAIRWITDCDLV